MVIAGSQGLPVGMWQGLGRTTTGNWKTAQKAQKPLRHPRGYTTLISPRRTDFREQLTHLHRLQLPIQPVPRPHSPLQQSPTLGCSQTTAGHQGSWSPSAGCVPTVVLCHPEPCLRPADPPRVPQSYPAMWPLPSLSFHGCQTPAWSEVPSCLLLPPLSFTGASPNKSLAHLIPAWCLPL